MDYVLGVKTIVEKVISGGQTGVDRAALDQALALDIPCGGWCPEGRRAEDGNIPAAYPLRQTASRDYAARTELDVRDSCATLVITRGPPDAGSRLTLEIALALGRPISSPISPNRPIPARSPAGWRGKGCGCSTSPGRGRARSPEFTPKPRAFSAISFAAWAPPSRTGESARRRMDESGG